MQYYQPARSQTKMLVRDKPLEDALSRPVNDRKGPEPIEPAAAQKLQK